MTDQNGHNPNDPVMLLLDQLIAALIDEEPRTWEMGANKIYPEDIQAYPMHSRILEIIYYLEADGIAPTFEAVRDTLLAAGHDQYVRLLGEPPTVDEFGTGILFHQSEHLDARSPSYALKQVYLLRRRSQEMVARINDVLNQPVGMPRDHLEEAIQVAQEYADSLVDDEPLKDQTEVRTDWLAKVRENVRKREQGIDPGPSWPFERLKEMVPIMRRGDVHMLQAKSGWGKTLMGGIFAEHWAWEQGYNVCVFLLETSRNQYFTRQVARNCGIPSRYSDTGRWNPDEDSEPTRRFRRFEEEKIDNTDLGFIHYQPSAGWRPAQLIAVIEAFERMSRAEGREAVYLIDYYSKIDASQWKNTNVPNNELAGWLKTITQQRDLYMFTLAQEKEGEGEYLPKGGDEIKKQSQVVMRLQRYRADSDMPLQDSRGPRMNAFGDPRYWHQTGQWASGAILQVIKANQDATGSVRLNIENDMCNIIESGNQDNLPEIPHQ